MAKLLVLVAILLVASAVVADAHTAPAPAPTVSKAAAPVPAPPPARGYVKSTSYFLKCIIHNVAERNVTFKLVIQGSAAGKVVAKGGQWTAIGPVKVGCRVPVVRIVVTVKTTKGVAVTKSFPVQLAAFLKDILPKSSKSLVLTASEVKSWMGYKRLVIKVGRKVMLVVKL